MKVDTEKKKLTVWLAKMPKYLGEKILKLQPGAKIGHLLINRATNASSASINIKLADIFKSSLIPTEHIIDIKEKANGMYLINSSKESMAIEGIVNKECHIRPVINSEYLEYKRMLKARQEGNENQVRVIDYFSEIKRTSKYSSIREMELLARKRKEMLQNKKRERLEKEDVLEIVFNAFEKHEFWTVRDLADFSGQPVAYIQEIVSEICVLNKKDHKNSYELKPEYKQHY